VYLRGLDFKGLRARWQSVLQRPAPDHLPRRLPFAIIAYRIQADRLGDLDHQTRQLLDPIGAKESCMGMSARLISFDQKRTELTPGTVLVREWDRPSQPGAPARKDRPRPGEAIKVNAGVALAFAHQITRDRTNTHNCQPLYRPA
jgi:Protein of unknown function (DUF2924)